MHSKFMEKRASSKASSSSLLLSKISARNMTSLKNDSDYVPSYRKKHEEDDLTLQYNE